MICRYTLKDAERWAEFSGDRNPIHFDLAHARQLGSEHLLVHGMRAMLDMKRTLSACLLECGESVNWLKFSARLRKPLRCEQVYKLSATQAGGRLNASFCDPEEASEYFTARLAPCSPQAWLLVPPGELRDITLAPALKASFPGKADDLTERWIFLDALLFQALLSSPELLSALKALYPECPANALQDFFALTPVVQTHHEVQFSAGLFADVPDPQMAIDILPPQVAGSPEAGLVMRIDIRGWFGSRPQIVTSVTFRTSPQRPTHQKGNTQ